MPKFIRSACLTNYVEVARSVGLDPYRQLTAAGLSRACLVDPDTMIRASAVGRLLETSAQAAGIEDFGLRMADTRRPSILGPIGLVLQEEPSLRKALDSLCRYLRLHSDSLELRIEEEEDTAIIREERIAQARVPARQVSDLTIGALHRIMRSLLGAAWKPERVCFSHGAPTSTAAYVRFFGCPVEFGCDFNGIVCTSKNLDARLPKADPVMARYARQYLDSILERPDATMANKVRQFVRALLPSGRCSIEQVSRHLGIDRRTVHRHLARDKETFSSIVDAVRADLATRYLERADRPLAEVADLLGFSGLSALSRWFSGHFGCSASSWRAGHLVPHHARGGRAGRGPDRVHGAAPTTGGRRESMR
jgi:AraC-like DNA-binding protein